jgi:hypothetical protein
MNEICHEGSFGKLDELVGKGMIPVRELGKQTDSDIQPRMNGD